jgi:hypothetical protein
VADVNGDGKLDLIVANYYSESQCNANGSVGVLLGNGDGTFQTAVCYSSGGTEPTGIAVADVNGDGKLDILVANVCAGSNCSMFGGDGAIGVLLGNGDGTFQAAVTYSSGGGDATSVAVADVNGDGKPDLLVANSCDTSGNTCNNDPPPDGSVSVLLGNGDGTFQPAVSYDSGGKQTLSMAVADINGDGRPDLLVANPCAATSSSCYASLPGSAGVLLGNGDGTFQAAVTYSSSGEAVSVAVADVNGDGKPDLLLADGSADVLLGNGDGTFQTGVSYYNSDGSPASAIAVGDVNGDGKPDLLVLSSETSPLITGLIGVLLGNGDGTFQPGVTFNSGGFGGFPGGSVAAADVNGDGKPDVVVANPYYARDLLNGIMGVLINTSTTATKTALVSSLNPSNFGQAVTFTATVTAQAGFSKGTPTGTVTFFDGITNIGNANLNGGGVASLMISTLAVGTHSITATYNGDTNFAPSTSAVVSQEVQGVVLSPTSLNFGSQTVGVTSAPQSVMLVNSGSAVLTISSIGITGANKGEFSQTNNCPGSLIANGSCTINVTFTPTALGNASAAVSVTDSAGGSPQSVSLTGSGYGAAVSLSPSSVTFPSQYVGTSGLPQTVTVTNTGTAALTITNVNTSVADFGTLSNCTNTVQPGTNCTIGVFFDPAASGTRTGNLLITDNASGSPQTLTLTGTGQDFSMAASGSSTATVSPGQTANYKVSVAPGGGFNQTVTFNCSGAPSQSTCALSPSSVVLSGSSPASINVTLTTAGTSAVLMYPDGLPPASNRLALWLALSGFSGLVLLGRSGDRFRKWHRGLLYGLAFVCLFSLAITWSACGGGSGSNTMGGAGTPAGTYNLTVTGTFTSGSTTLSHVTKLKLVVQ